jgi:hypothetical protein
MATTLARAGEEGLFMTVCSAKPTVQTCCF